MWTGYLDERAKNQGLCDFLAPYRYRVLHTSGHASLDELRTLYETMNPKRGLIPIHTEAPEAFEALIPGGRLILLDDGEKFTL
jgi:mRNA degradation ribonuclease J1/J2